MGEVVNELTFIVASTGEFKVLDVMIYLGEGMPGIVGLRGMSTETGTCGFKLFPSYVFKIF